MNGAWLGAGINYLEKLPATFLAVAGDFEPEKVSDTFLAGAGDFED
jgi:hypothetical protein